MDTKSEKVVPPRAGNARDSNEGSLPPLRKVKTVSVAQAESGFQIHVDGKPVHTPERRVLESAKRPIIGAIALEWTAQGGAMNPSAMPLTRLLATQLDRVAPQRDAIIAGLAAYIDADVLCYRAPEPPDLKARQQAEWQPILDWLAQTFGISLTTVEGIAPARQSDAAGAAFVAALQKLDDVRLTALQAAAAVTSSVGLSLALAEGRLDAAAVHAAAHLDELFQIERWGEDEMARQRRDAIAADLEAIGRYLELSV